MNIKEKECIDLCTEKLRGTGKDKPNSDNNKQSGCKKNDEQ